MIIAVSAGPIAARRSSTAAGWDSANVVPCFRKSSKKLTRSSVKPQSPFASQTTMRSSFVSPAIARILSSCSSFSTKMSRASEWFRRYLTCSGAEVG